MCTAITINEPNHNPRGIGVQYGVISRLWRLRSVNWADLTSPLPSRRPITYNLLYVNSLAVEEDS